VPTVEKGRVIGHEGVGVVESVGKDVQDFKVYTNCRYNSLDSLLRRFF